MKISHSITSLSSKNMQTKIRAGIVGASGYTGGELIRLLVQHPNAEINFAYSRTHHGKALATIHSDLIGDTTLQFTDTINPDVDVVFTCLPHGETGTFLKNNPISDKVKIIDLSNEFRLKNTASGFVYGLPEINKNKIKSAQKIANPGCFATAIQSALLPLAKAGLLQSAIHVSGTTGSTGAGNKLTASSHFTWRNNNFSTYKAFTHQHLDEIGESVLQLQPSFSSAINFIPHRGNFTRGILITAYTEIESSLDEIKKIYNAFYSDAPFVFISDVNIDIKQVVNTNKCLLYLEKQGNQLLVTAVLDNLLKGASGQAVQNMNLMFGFDEMAGLRLKPLAY